MSLAFGAQQEKDIVSKCHNAIPKATVQKLLDENTHLIKTISEYQNCGDIENAAKMQQLLHRNLVFMASVADNGSVNPDFPDPESGCLDPLTVEDVVVPEPSPAPPIENGHAENHSQRPHSNGEHAMAPSVPSVLQQQLQQGQAQYHQPQYAPHPQPQQHIPPPNVYPQYAQGPPGGGYGQGPPHQQMYPQQSTAPPVGAHPQQQYVQAPQGYPVPNSGYHPHGQPVYIQAQQPPNSQH